MESPVESGEDRSENPRIPMRGMGGAAAVRLIATAARRACTGAASTAQPLPHVPISHDAKYFFCSFVSLSILIPIPASFSLAISLSISAGTG